MAATYKMKENRFSFFSSGASMGAPIPGAWSAAGVLRGLRRRRLSTMILFLLLAFKAFDIYFVDLFQVLAFIHFFSS